VDDWYLWPAVDFASIHGSNIRSDATVTLRSSPDNFSSTSSGSTFVHVAMPLAAPAFYSALSSAVDHRYWEFRILHTASTPTESVWIGEAVIGQATALTRPQDLGQELRYVADNVRLPTPFGGARVHRYGEVPRRILGMGFNFYTTSEYQEARRKSSSVASAVRIRL
jgi:hypothetical protein